MAQRCPKARHHTLQQAWKNTARTRPTEVTEEYYDKKLATLGLTEEREGVELEAISENEREATQSFYHQHQAVLGEIGGSLLFA